MIAGEVKEHEASDKDETERPCEYEIEDCELEEYKALYDSDTLYEDVPLDYEIDIIDDSDSDTESGSGLDSSEHIAPPLRVIMPDPCKNKLAEYLAARQYAEVGPIDFYRHIFKTGILAASSTDPDKKKRRGKVQTLIIAKDTQYQTYEETGYPKSFFDGLKELDYAISDSLNRYAELAQKGVYGSESVFITTLANACSYYRKETDAGSMYQLFALIIEIDDIIGADKISSPLDSCAGMERLLEGFQNQDFPTPTYIVCSGKGLHLYYVFDRPIRLNKEHVKYQYVRLDEYKKALMNRMWTPYISNSEPQIQGIVQKYRVVGTPTKYGSICRAFRYGDTVSLDYMNSFCNILGCKTIIELYDKQYKMPRYGIPNAGINLGDTPPKKEKKERKGTLGLGAFDSALKAICEQVEVGHRYNAVLGLAAVAKMCNISYEYLRKTVLDEDGLLDILNEIDGAEWNPFTVEEAEKAMGFYFKNQNFMKRETFEELSGVELPEKKTQRNGRNRKEHMEYMKQIRAEKRAKGEIVDGGGRPAKWWPVFAYRLRYPEGKKADCIKCCGLSKNTVSKYWDLYDKMKDQLPWVIEHFATYTKCYPLEELLEGNINMLKPVSYGKTSTELINIKKYTKVYLEESGWLE